LQQWFGPSFPNAYRGQNLLNPVGSVNSRASFPATLATAGVPYGFSSSIIGTANGVVISGATIVNRDGKRWWTINASAPTGTAPRVAMTLGGFNSAATYPITITAGQTYGFEFDFFIETQDGSVLPTGTSFLAKVLMTDGTNTLTYFNIATRTVTVVSNGTGSRWTGHMVFNPITLDTGSATLTSSSVMTFEVFMVHPNGKALTIGIAGVNIVQL
jgi:hypothetical protein